MMPGKVGEAWQLGRGLLSECLLSRSVGLCLESVGNHFRVKSRKRCKARAVVTIESSSEGDRLQRGETAEPWERGGQVHGCAVCS